MRAERRDPTLRLRMVANPGGEEPVSEAKPYDIPKQLVWEAYQRVKANRGAAGVDGVSLATFEQNLKGNLYKVWNRMSSGSYHPPPVRLVEIPKDNGGTRPLGIPTIADRVAQTLKPIDNVSLWETTSHRAVTQLRARRRRIRPSPRLLRQRAASNSTSPILRLNRS